MAKIVIQSRISRSRCPRGKRRKARLLPTSTSTRMSQIMLAAISASGPSFHSPSDISDEAIIARLDPLGKLGGKHGIIEALVHMREDRAFRPHARDNLQR